MFAHSPGIQGIFWLKEVAAHRLTAMHGRLLPLLRPLRLLLAL